MKMHAMLGCGMLAALGLLGAMAMAEDGPATKPAKKPKLTHPWSLLTTLSDEQKAQIIGIHQTATDACNAIRDKEETDIQALLTEEQKKDVVEAVAAKKAAEKLKAAERKKSE